MPLIFKTKKNSQPVGTFSPSEPKSWTALDKRFNDLTADFNKDRISFNRLYSQNQEILKAEPSYLRSFFLLLQKSHISDNAKNKPSVSEFESFLLPVRNLIPDDFHGYLDTEEENVSIFLFCHFSYILALIEEGRFDTAARECLAHSGWDREGRYGTSDFVGNLYIILDSYDEAVNYLEGLAGHDPEAKYSLALARFLKGDYRQAIDCLRQAFVLQPFIAESLVFSDRLPPFPSDFPNRESAIIQAFRYQSFHLGGQAWQNHPKAIDFLASVYESPDVLRERGNMLLAVRDALQADPSLKDIPAEILPLLAEFAASQPDAATTAKLMRRTSVAGKSLYPWEINNRWLEIAEKESEVLKNIVKSIPSGLSCDDSDSCEDCEDFEICNGQEDESVCADCEECEIGGFCQDEEEDEGSPAPPPLRH
jgi:tetratricopeptide (TPR) repeat protein